MVACSGTSARAVAKASGLDFKGRASRAEASAGSSGFADRGLGAREDCMRPLVSLSTLNTLTSCRLVEPPTSAAADPNSGAAPVPLTDAELDAVSAGRLKWQ